MTIFYHDVDPLAFQYQVLGVAKEMKFRLTELIEASSREIALYQLAMESGRPSEEANEPRENVFAYRFGSLIALLQTFRDALIGALGKTADISSLEIDVPHAELFRNLRNALVHDGYQPLNLWVEGRYYFPVNIRRTGMGGKVVLIDAPAEDIETLALQYVSGYGLRLAILLETLPPQQRLQGPQRDYDWFQAASKHPAVEKMKIMMELPSRDKWPVPPTDERHPIDVAASQLRELIKTCETRLSTLDLLRTYPFP
ncbi:hypothetical protein [Janthinobacterium sp. NKUCC06_STL]|uniref:hypothetical protein n=1 Tax=Janthinobacterium sp. NKUCC06_STL TaxID=2842127 RepID=UPI001C5B6FDB|nr:hypothetical protein [Janthinobacterium sp. NKUCC06_STL]MBW3507916.1 hypothetical protein [Janthinobacterium sp. NKUCC06_STL]